MEVEMDALPKSRPRYPAIIAIFARMETGQRVPLYKIFLVFCNIGAFTVGGGYAMVPAIQSEIVGRGWLREEEFPDIIALAQGAPGLIAVNISIFAGYRIRGFKGSVAATLGSICMPFLAILLIAMFFTSFKDNIYVEKAFKGIRPVTVALIAAPTVSMARGNKTWWSWAASAVVLAGVALLKFSPIYILLTVIAISVAAAWYGQGRSGR